MRQDFGALGRRALATLVDMIDGRPPPAACLRISPHLVARASASAPGADRGYPPGGGLEPGHGGRTHDR